MSVDYILQRVIIYVMTIYRKLKFKDYRELVMEIVQDIYTDDGQNSLVWDDLKTYEDMVNYIDTHTDGTRSEITYEYEEALEWVENQKVIQFELVGKRYLYRIVDNAIFNIEDILKFLNIKYKYISENDLEDEIDEILYYMEELRREERIYQDDLKNLRGLGY